MSTKPYLKDTRDVKGSRCVHTLQVKNIANLKTPTELQYLSNIFMAFYSWRGGGGASH